MVHSTRPGAFRPAPPRDIYNANTDPQPDPPPPWWVFRTGQEKSRADSMFFVLAPRPPASETSG